MTFFSALTSGRFAHTVLLALCWLLAVRASHILQSGIWANPAAMLASDLAGALVLAVLLCVTSGALRGLMIILLGCAAFVAGMHLTIHGTLFQLSLIGKGVDPTFITGSLINKHSLLLPVYLLFAWLLHWLHRRLLPTAIAGGKGLVVFAALVLAVYGTSVQSLTTPANNLVASFFSQLPGAVVSPFASAANTDGEQAENAQDLPENTNFFHQQVAAPYVENPPNVLLIMIEGLSAGYFPSVSNYHNLDPSVKLGSLEENLNRHGFRIYRNALSMERQTDRGTFSILCGEYPDFRRQSRKMVDVAEDRASADCMPSRLLDSGYTTAYWQAAPLDYMRKGDFMPRVGFEDVTGAEVFISEGEQVEGWGPPDPTYFDNIGKRIRRLDATSDPWMVTLLNVGTHHPFNTGKRKPDDGFDAEDLEELADAEPQEARREAMKTMAESLNRFLDGLASDGILDDTLVILTSDESGGFIRKDPESLPLNNNVGVLAVRPPNGDSLARYAPGNRIVAQIDVPPTILDVTGLGRKTGDMIGRSLLVWQTDTERDLLLADTYTGLKYFLRESGQLLSCSELMTSCSAWTFDPERLFGTLEEVDVDPFLTFEERTALFNNAAYMKPVENP
ncbi:sulfatase-like hydrolase/transferase [Marinobacter sp. SS13-12]|uniref:LTA synthase family protein n=1 Tax=Marinobacter sp. SS13-12 TaxID=3050451 RepID=UPI002555EA7E|nr:sulfatase-like hydrolase/transferase [Marinobacter sp. SS13-12]MDK8464056.1 sulfatase-like hydrolase/transferase [Marinobacter sp. SS13-12]